jgi:hypothetical protein
MTTNTTHGTTHRQVEVPEPLRIPARDVTLSDLLDEDGLLHAVTSVRLQGANPSEVLIELEGIAGRRHYPTTAVLTVHRQAA